MNQTICSMGSVTNSSSQNMGNDTVITTIGSIMMAPTVTLSLLTSSLSSSSSPSSLVTSSNGNGNGGTGNDFVNGTTSIVINGTNLSETMNQSYPSISSNSTIPLSSSSAATTNHNNTKINKNPICRDFVRGLCRRKLCRYPHVLSSELVVFCHDFQNSSCSRINCKFLHYTLQEEKYYRKYGEFPQEFIGGGSSIPLGCINNETYNGQLQCKEQIIYGNCRHRDCYLTNNGRLMEREQAIWNDASAYRVNDRSINGLNEYRTTCDEFQAIKRSSRDTIDSLPFKRYRDDHDRIDIMPVIRRFEEEQIMLRRRVEANEIKIAELRASNEYLIAQNAQLRLNNVQQCSSNVGNTVTVTQTTSQPPQGPQQQQVIGGVSIAPVQVQATPIVSIATPQTQIITNSGQPLAIAATNTSQGQQLTIAQQNITSLSNTSQTLAPTHTQQILGTSQITLAPAALAQAPSMGLTINTSQALAMSNATQPIISYPVMTHSILPH